MWRDNNFIPYREDHSRATRYEEESTNALRGMFIACLLSLPLWLILAALWHVWHGRW